MPRPVTEYFQVFITSDDEALQFSTQMLNAAESFRAMMMFSTDSRPVALQSLGVDGEAAFVSPGAARLLKEVGAPFRIAPTPTPLSELPDGLALLCGDNADLMAYYDRHSGA